MDFFDPTAELIPDSPCPTWCAMHIDGCHVAQLGEPTFENELYLIYVRETDEGAGEVGLEVIVAAKDSLKTTRVSIPPEAVEAAAAQSEAQTAASIRRALNQAIGKQAGAGEDEEGNPGR